MPDEHKYEVQECNCVASIAEKRGFFWQTLWERNPDLGKKRKKPKRAVAWRHRFHPGAPHQRGIKADQSAALLDDEKVECFCPA